jgi:D-alanyl-D-alanine carboxypeptidase
MVRRTALTGVLISSLICAIVLPGSTAAAGEDPAAKLQETLQLFAQENPTAPGVTAAVVCPALGLDWTGAVGAVDFGDAEALSPAHTFRIASNTKTYVAAAVLRLAELGRLDLDDPLSAHLSAERAGLLAADGYDLQAMTLRQVLSHTSGLFEHPADPRYEQAILADPGYPWTAAEQIQRCVEWGDPVAGPGEIFSYSDTGYVILGGIIEDLTGRSLGPAVRDLLDYGTLGLDSTWWESMEPQPPGSGSRAHQYYGDRDTWDWNPSLDLYGGGGIVTDVDELGAFMRALLKGRVLRQEATLAAMTGDGTPGYRLGLMCLDLGGHLAWGHTGFWNTFAFHVPALDLTVSGCVLNHHAAKGQELARRLVLAAQDQAIGPAAASQSGSSADRSR